MKYYAYTIIAIVAAAIVAGFFIVGSPNYARLLQQDDRRVSDLQMIQSEILNFWMNKAKLPKMLSELNDSIKGFNVPKDPVTGADYSYKITAPESFQLCAVFAKPGLNSQNVLGRPVPASAPAIYPIPYGQENWQHGSGQTCFDRKIDKELYRPVPTIKK